MANKKRPSSKKKSSREASQEPKSDSEKDLSMFNELHDPEKTEFQAKLAETLISVGIEINEYEKQSEVFKGTFIKMRIDTNFCVPTIYRLVSYMKIATTDTSSASFSPSLNSIQAQINKTESFM